MAVKQRGRKKGRPLKKKKPQKKYQLSRPKHKLTARKPTRLTRRTKTRQPRRAMQPRKARQPQGIGLRGPKTRQPHNVIHPQGSKSKVGRGKKLKICSPRIFVSQMLRKFKKVRMAAKAKDLVKSMLMDIYSYVENEVEIVNQMNKASSLSLTDIHTFVNQAINREVAKHVVNNTNTTPIRDATSNTSIFLDPGTPSPAS